MSLKQKSINSNKNLFTVFLFFVFFSCYLTIGSKTNIAALEDLKFEVNSKISSYKPSTSSAFLEMNPESMQGLLNKLIEVSQQPEGEEQTKTFSQMIEKVRKLVDEMIKEQKDSDVIFNNNVAILTKYFLTSKNNIEILQDKYKLAMTLVEFYRNIKNSKGVIDYKSDFTQLIGKLEILKSNLKTFSTTRNNFDEITSAYYYNLKEYLLKAQESIQIYDSNFKNGRFDSLKNIFKSFNADLAISIRNAFINNIDVSKEITLLERYISIFDNATQNESGTVQEGLFAAIDDKIKIAEEEANSLSVKIKGAGEINKSSANSLKSGYEEYLKNTNQRTDIILTILKILDFMNMRIKKVSVNFMVYLEQVKDGFKDYVNSYEFIKIKEYIFKTIAFNEEGKKLVEDFHKSKNIVKQ